MNGTDSCYENVCFASRSRNCHSESMMYGEETWLALGHIGNYSAQKLYHGRIHEPVFLIHGHF